MTREPAAAAAVIVTWASWLVRPLDRVLVDVRFGHA